MALGSLAMLSSNGSALRVKKRSNSTKRASGNSVRKPNPEHEYEYAFWRERFCRILLTKKPILRWELDEARVEILFQSKLAPYEASTEYLRSDHV